MMSSKNLVWKGYAIKDTKNWDKFEIIDFDPKKPGDYDIDVKIEYCGVCGSDVHAIAGDWGKPILPIIPGHEIVGYVVRVGPKVTQFNIGDRAGVGAQICSCLECDRCKNDNENYCMKLVHTYNSKYPNGDIAQGGYSTAVRAHERFTFPIPKELKSEEAAPMLCGGLTVFSPLVRHGAGPDSWVGIVGIGGLGHYAIQFAKALGSKVVAFSHSPNKEKDAKELGADKFVETKGGFAESLRDKLDLIICTADISKGIPLQALLSTLKVHGRFIMVGMPDEDLPPINSKQLAENGCFIGGSHVGNKEEVIRMLNLAVEKKVKSYIELLPMKECGKAVRNVREGKVRYRHVLKTDI